MKKKEKRLIITIDEEMEEFKLDMPDGDIDPELIITVIDTLLDKLVSLEESTDDEENDDEDPQTDIKLN